MIYEVIPTREEADLEVGGVFLKETVPGPELAERLETEAGRWQAVERVHYEKTLFWHNDDREAGSYTVIHSGVPRVVKDGAFFGLLVTFRDTDSLGMSSHSEEKRVLLCADGRKLGEAIRRADHTSSEVETSEEGVFSLEPAQQSKKEG